MSDEEEKLQLDVYDEFKSYAYKYLRDENPRLTLEDFSAKTVGPTHITLKLVYCSRATENMYELVKKFDPSAKLTSRAKLMEEGSIYKVSLPWRDRRPKKRKYYDDDDDEEYEDEDEEPKIIDLMKWSMGLLVVGLLGALSTEKTQWYQLMGY